MTDRELELRLSDWYVDETAGSTTDALRTRVMAIPDRSPVGSNWFGRPRWMVAAALLLLGLVLGGVVAGAGGLLRPPRQADRLVVGPAEVDPAVVDPAVVDPAALLARAVDRAGLKQGTMKRNHDMTSWGARVSVNDVWDGGWNDRHLLFRTVSTTGADATELLREDPLAGADVEWDVVASGVWVGTAEARSPLYAVAVSAEPYFFIVTGGDVDRTRAVAEAVLAELRASPPTLDGQASPGRAAP